MSKHPEVVLRVRPIRDNPSSPGEKTDWHRVPADRKSVPADGKFTVFCFVGSTGRPEEAWRNARSSSSVDERGRLTEGNKI